MHAARWCVGVALAAAACASAPKFNYYTLAVEPSESVRPALNLRVERFRTTGALGDDRIHIQASPIRVEYYATERWAATVGEIVQRKLAAEFGPARAGRRTLVVTGTVLACGQVDREEGAAAHVKLALEIRDPARKRFEPPLLEKTYEAMLPAAAPAADAVVDALSRCVERIAAEIVEDAAGL
jgi:uncharacterized lipoprotein YmbA